MENPTVHAPYNFIPFSNRVILRYESPDELPPHDKLNPSLKSGEIHVTLKAETPVFVSDGQEHFFRGANGRLMIPGSSIRGMLRENMQILGYGLIQAGEDMADYQIFFRNMASARDSNASKLKQYYAAALDIKTDRDRGKTFSVPQNVKTGYLTRQNGRYLIFPTKEGFFRTTRKAVREAGLGDGNARNLPVAYTASGVTVSRLCAQGKAEAGMKRGTLLVTGRPVGRIENHIYVFSEADMAETPIELTEKEVIAYKEDWEARKNSLKPYYDVNFWALPEEGAQKPVFYIRYEQHTYFGMSRFLRIGYKHALSEGLPPRHLELKNDRLPPLDYPHAILGFAGKEAAFRSRVSVGDFPTEGEPAELPPCKPILYEPKPSYFPGYVVDGKHYNEEDFRLRGYKQYWLKDVDKATATSTAGQSALRPLPKGTRFHGIIRFKNLHEDELGLLLWALCLEEGCYQSIGMGKPYGYGRMKLSVDELRENDVKTLYSPSGIFAAPQNTTDKIAAYIRTYDRFASSFRAKNPKKAKAMSQKEEIRDFFYMRSTIKSGDFCSYMLLPEYTHNREQLPTVRNVRSEGEAAAPAKQETTLQALAERFNKPTL